MVNVDTQYLEQAILNRVFNDDLNALKTTSQNTLVSETYDCIIPTFNSTTTVFTYKSGGLSGTTVATVTMTYTNSTKLVLQSIVRT